MKKIFYILASAIVALGAVACENDGLDNIGLEVNGDTVSFVASIDNTKTALNGLETVWDDDDVIVVKCGENEYTFSNKETGDKNKFSCTAVGVTEILTAETITATYSHEGCGTINSAVGTQGALLTYTGSFAELANGTKGFEVKNAFLKFTTTEKVTLKGAGLFVENGVAKDEITITGTGKEQYVAVNTTTAEIAFSYSVGSVQCKSLTKNFTAKTIYKLGTLTAPDYLIKGINDDWANGIGMFKEGDWYVARNVNVTKKSEFKFNSGNDWTANGGTVVINNAYSVTKGQGNNSTIAVGKYDFYLNTAVNTFYIMAPGTTKYDNGWIFVGSNIEGAGNWNVNAKDPSLYWDIIEQQNYGIITVKAGAEFKFVKEGSNWSEQYGANSGSQEISLDSANPTALNSAGNSANLKLSKAGTYKVYLDFGKKKVWAVLQQ